MTFTLLLVWLQNLTLANYVGSGDILFSPQILKQIWFLISLLTVQKYIEICKHFIFKKYIGSSSELLYNNSLFRGQL